MKKIIFCLLFLAILVTGCDKEVVTGMENYNSFLKKNKEGYLEEDTLKLFSIYSHSFDNGYSYSEASDCD